jgi:hypothetical protein
MNYAYQLSMQQQQPLMQQQTLYQQQLAPQAGYAQQQYPTTANNSFVVSESTLLLHIRVQQQQPMYGVQSHAQQPQQQIALSQQSSYASQTSTPAPGQQQQHAYATDMYGGVQQVQQVSGLHGGVRTHVRMHRTPISHLFNT